MDDASVKETRLPVSAPAESETADLGKSGPGKETTGESKLADVSTPSGLGGDELSNLKAAVQESRNRYKQSQVKTRELEKSLAELKAAQESSKYAGDDVNAVYQHPEFVKLYNEHANFRLKEAAADTLAQFPDIPEDMAKAIKKNPRGWIGDAKDPDTAIINLRASIEDLADEVAARKLEIEAQAAAGDPAVKPKNAKVAGTNTSAGTKGPGEEEVDAILAKPVTEWTREEMAILEKYNKKK